MKSSYKVVCMARQNGKPIDCTELAAAKRTAATVAREFPGQQVEVWHHKLLMIAKTKIGDVEYQDVE